MDTTFTEADHIHDAVRQVNPSVRTHQLGPEEKESVRVMQVHGNFPTRKRPCRQIGKIRRKPSARRINFLIFVEARGRRIVQREVGRNDGGKEEEIDNFHGELVTNVRRI
jgi:hypothetical protein